MTATSEISGLSGLRKAAILLTVLGEEAAATVFRNLNAEDVQRVADEVAGLGTISTELSLQIFEEYRKMTQAQDYIVKGGYDLARRLLIKALGISEAEGILQRLAKARDLNPLESLQRADPQKLARFLEGQAVELPHARPALEIRQRLERDQNALARHLFQGRELGGVHLLHAGDRPIAAQTYAQLQLVGVLLELDQHAPQQQPALAGAGAGVDLRPDARRPVSVEIARRCEGSGLRQLVVGRHDAQRMQVGEALEHRAYRVARPLGRLRRRRIAVALAQQRQIGLDDELLGALAAQATTVDACRLACRRRG